MQSFREIFCEDFSPPYVSSRPKCSVTGKLGVFSVVFFQWWRDEGLFLTTEEVQGHAIAPKSRKWSPHNCCSLKTVPKKREWGIHPYRFHKKRKWKDDNCIQGAHHPGPVGERLFGMKRTMFPCHALADHFSFCGYKYFWKLLNCPVKEKVVLNRPSTGTFASRSSPN